MQKVRAGANKFNDKKTVRSGVLLVMCVVAGTLGVSLLLLSHAASPSASIEPEAGTRSTNASRVADTTASGGYAVKFTTGSTATTITVAIAGDIGVDPGTNDTKTANLIKADSSIQYVLAMGDLAYPNATEAEFRYYDETWGAFKSKTYPALGNHELFADRTAQPYVDYWLNKSVWAGDASPPSVVTTALSRAVADKTDNAKDNRFYYSFDLGNWHLIAFDSSKADRDSASDQMAWLKADLAATNQPCVLAFAHHPFVSASSTGTATDLKPMFQALYDTRADVFLAGHEHDYVAFNKINPNNAADTKGVRPWVVGAGGTGARTSATATNANQTKFVGSNGYLKMQLQPSSYTWTYFDASGASRDSGSDTCNTKS